MPQGSHKWAVEKEAGSHERSHRVRTSRVENDAFPLVIQRATALPLPYLHALCAAFNYLSQPWMDGV